MSITLTRCAVIASVFLVSACESDTASDKACFEASHAQAEAMGRVSDVRPNNFSEFAAWTDVISAATEWKKKACSNTKGEFTDQVQKLHQSQAK